MSDPSRDIALTCKSCGHGWSVTAPTGVPVSEWVAELQRHACPSCGALYRVTSQLTKSDNPETPNGPPTLDAGEPQE